ncbi:hypothetical protein BHE74_00019534 [Ensete ventricosum]|nr:hypothetical protein BHE74_00019534 [Ensete ventricosum]
MKPLAQPQASVQLQHHSRINLSVLKSQIAKQLGTNRAQCYFSYLNGLLSQKLSKSEFNKLCFVTLGPENLPLHNQLIGSILRNACQAKTLPPINHEKGVQNPVKASLKKKSRLGHDGFNSSQTPTSLPISSNGRNLPLSPCRVTVGSQNWHFKDHQSPPEPHGTAEIASDQSVVTYDEVVSRENGDLSSSNLKRLQHQQGDPMEQLAKRPRLAKPLLHDQGSVHGKDLVVKSYVEDRDILDHWECYREPLRAPLGIPFCSASIGGERRCLLPRAGVCSDGFGISYHSGELCNTEMLKKQMEKMAEAHGLGGVTMDCVNLLNNSLDTYLKRLIRSCVELVRARTGHELIKQTVSRLQSYTKPIAGTWVGNNIPTQIGGLLEGSHELKNCCSISMQDFMVAMELNPQQLGEDWPLLLEKIRICSFEESDGSR